MENKNVIKVGVAVVIFNDKNEVLVEKRINSHGSGTFCCPGGHVEYGEAWAECAEREVMEECNINIKNIKFGTVTNDLFIQPNSLEVDNHYITIFLVAEYDSGEVRINEPHKCESLEWMEWDKIPEPLFLPHKNLIDFDPLKIKNN